MRVVILNDAQQVATTGKDIFIQQLADKPDSVLGLATGSTPVALYQQLICAGQKGEVSFSQATTFNLDEYLGLASDHPQSYRHFMQKQLFDHIDIQANNTHVPDGSTDSAVQACEDYEHSIANSGGIDLQLLGLGRNGHIGFNEPSSSLGSRTRVKTLTQETIKDNARFFKQGEFQPKLSLTMGIETIMQARKILLLATGSDKAEAVRAMVEGAISASCPASILQMHRNAIVVLDRDAAQQLDRLEFYLFVEQENAKLAAQQPASWPG